MNSCFSHVRLRLADMKDLAGIAALEMTVFSHPWNEEMVNMDTMQSIEKAEGHVLCAMAVKFGKARLIDNFIAEL